MTKEDFINFLEKELIERKNIPHFSKTYTNSEDYWDWNVPAVDGLQPDIRLVGENVILTTNKTLCENEEPTIEEFTFDGFIEIYKNFSH